MVTSAPTAITVEALEKSYGTRRAVDGVSFEVARGEIFALLGPNGAGKTTTIEILEGYRQPDGGRVAVLGFDPTREGDKVKPRIGVMLQEGGLYPAITPLEALRLFARFYPDPRDPHDLLRLVGLQDAGRTRYRRLSGGQKQRLALALALVGRPEVLFLDEPTAGLDPQARRTTWEIISSLRREGVTIMLTTHYLEEAERLADRVAILDQGRIVALDSPEALVRSNASIVRLRAGGPVDPAALRALPSARSLQERDGTFVLETADAATLLVEITSLLRERGTLATEIRVGQASLEDVFLEMTAGGEL